MRLYCAEVALAQPLMLVLEAARGGVLAAARVRRVVGTGFGGRWYKSRETVTLGVTGGAGVSTGGRSAIVGWAGVSGATVVGATGSVGGATGTLSAMAGWSGTSGTLSATAGSTESVCAGVGTEGSEDARTELRSRRAESMVVAVGDPGRPATKGEREDM